MTPEGREGARPTRLSWALAGAALACTLVPGDGRVRGPLALALGALVLLPLLYFGARGRPEPQTAPAFVRALASLSPRRFLVGVFGLELLLAATASVVVFEAIPHVQDSIAQLFHGRILARGHLTAPSPPLPAFFTQQHVIVSAGRWYSQYPPGHAAVLALGVIAGAPWLMNPLLGGLTVVALYFVGRELWDERTGRLCAVLGLLSPFVLFMSSEFMNHASALLGVALFVVFFARALRLASVRAGLLAGLALGFVVLTRPFSAAGVALPFAVFALRELLRRPRPLVAPLLAMGLSAGALAALLLAFNAETNGSPFVFGYHVLWGRDHDPGFGHSGWGEPHTPWLGLLHSLTNLAALNQYLFEWPFPSLLFVAALFALRASDRWDRLLLASGLSLVAFHFFYWYQDLCFGPRFLYEANVTWLALSARGIQAAADAAARAGRRRFLALVLASAFAIGWGVFVPLRAREYSQQYWGIDRSVLGAVERQGIGEGLVFVNSAYGAVLPANSPWLDQPLIFAVDLGRRNQRLMKLYPDKPAWLEKDGALVPAR